MRRRRDAPPSSSRRAPEPIDEYIALPGGFRACKVSSQHGATAYVREVRMEGPTFHDRNNIAVGVSWAAERLAIAYLDARASRPEQRP